MSGTERTIWKAILSPIGVQTITVPRGAELLCAREQIGQICVWFRCDPHEPFEERAIAIVGTGHGAPVEGDGRYLGTAILHDGQLVFHVFEKTAG